MLCIDRFVVLDLQMDDTLSPDPQEIWMRFFYFYVRQYIPKFILNGTELDIAIMYMYRPNCESGNIFGF